MPKDRKTRVCLIQPPPTFSEGDCCLPSDYMGVGLLALAAFLEANGIAAKIFHFPIAAAEGVSPSRVFQEISLFKPDVAAVGMNWTHFSSGAIEVSEKLKKLLTGVPVILGGQHASLFAGEIIEAFPNLFDAVIVGEAERPALEICRRATSGESFEGITGVATRESPNPEKFDFVENVDDLPFQSYSPVWPGYKRPVAALSTVRGACPHKCVYCLEGSSGIGWKGDGRRLHSERYIAEQALLFSKEGKTIFTIQDQFSHRGDAGAIKLAAEFRRLGVKPSEFNIFAETCAYGPEGLAALASISDELVTIDYGVETGSEKTARISKISFKKEKFLEQLEAATDAGILPYTWWLVGLPGEGPDEIEETREFIMKTMELGAIPRWITPLVLFPQTEMARNADQYNIKKRFTTFGHFARFSLERKNEFGSYPALSTHNGERLTGEQAAEAAVSLKKTVLENWGALDRFYGSRPRAGEMFSRMTRMLTDEKGSGFPLDSFF